MSIQQLLKQRLAYKSEEQKAEKQQLCVSKTQKKKKKRRKGNTTHCYSSSLRVSRIGLGGMEESRRLAISDKKKALRNRAKKKKKQT